MKEYQEVIKGRYNLEDDEALAQSIYSENHPIGKYSRKVIFSGLKDFVRWYSAQRGSFNDRKLLDLGCGGGEMLAFFASEGFNPSRMLGIDLSENRIQRAARTFSKIEFNCADAMNFDLGDRRFDLISSFDLYSHLSTSEQIIEALKTVRRHLAVDGLFLWYDIYSADHFYSEEQADSSGFNKQQMIELAASAGMEPVYFKSFFKLFLGRYHSLYQARRIPTIILRILEVVVPGKPGNLMLVFQAVDPLKT